MGENKLSEKENLQDNFIENGFVETGSMENGFSDANETKTVDLKTRFDLPDFILFTILLVGYTIAIFMNFRQQALGIVESDMAAYIEEMLGVNTKYPFSYPLYFKLGALVHVLIKSPEISMAVTATILCVLSVLILRFFMEANGELLIVRMPFMISAETRVNLRNNESLADENVLAQNGFLNVCIYLCRFFGRVLKRFGKTCMTFALLLVSMLFVPTGFRFPGVKFDYVGVFSPNPFHNATYNAARPFSIVVFFLFVRILLRFEKKISWKDFGLFSLFLFLTTLTKPSFTLVFVSTAGLVLLGRLFLNKWKTFVNSLLLGLTFVPTFALLLYQFFGVFGPVEEGERGIGISPLKVWGQYCTNVPMAVLLAAAFPIAFGGLAVWNRVFSRRTNCEYETANTKNSLCDKNVSETGRHVVTGSLLNASATITMLRFAAEMFVVSLVEFIVFYEKGFRMVDANFSWGYMSGLFFLYVSTGRALLLDTIQGRRKVWQIILLWIIFAAHLCCGIIYLLRILHGQSYY